MYAGLVVILVEIRFVVIVGKDHTAFRGRRLVAFHQFFPLGLGHAGRHVFGLFDFRLCPERICNALPPVAVAMEQRGISARLLKGGNDRGETCRGGIHAAREHDKGAPVGGIGQGGCVRRQLTGADEQDLGILQGAAARE